MIRLPPSGLQPRTNPLRNPYDAAVPETRVSLTLIFSRFDDFGPTASESFSTDYPSPLMSDPQQQGGQPTRPKRYNIIRYNTFSSCSQPVIFPFFTPLTDITAA